MDALIQLNTHPGIEEVYAEIQKKHPSISKTTVYRNLRQLAKNGAIRQILLPDGLERYDGTNTRHYHLKCGSCGNIFDVDVEYLADIDEIVRQKYGFHIDEHDVVFKGTCSKCGEIRK